jgi:hypothetical protein
MRILQAVSKARAVSENGCDMVLVQITAIRKEETYDDPCLKLEARSLEAGEGGSTRYI